MKMDKLLANAQQKGEKAELFQVTQHSHPVQFENNKLKSIRSHESTTTAVRLISREGRMGFCTTRSMEEDPETLLERARETSQFGREFRPMLPAEDPGPLDNMYDEDVTDFPAEEMIKMGEDLIATVLDENSNALASAGINKKELTVTLKNTEGLSTSYSRTSFGVGAGAMLVVGNSFLHIGQQKGLPRLFTDLSHMKRELRHDLQYGVKEKEVSSGSFPVLVAPEAMDDMVRPIMASLNGQSVEKEISPFRDKKGEALFDPRFTLTDMPHRPFSPGMCPVDDEGMPTQETPLINRGVIETFPVDLLTADALGTDPTGHGVRPGAGALPEPAVHTCVMAPGDQAYMDMLSSIEEGVLIKDLMGAWAGNPYSGEVNGNISLGFWVKNGKIRGRIKDCMISVNAFDAFKNHLVSLSQEAKWMGNFRFPYALLDAVNIVAK